MPYDRFIKEQIAADLLPGPGLFERLPALGFFALGPVYYGDPKKLDQYDDRIDTLSRGELPFRMLFGDRLLFTAQGFFPKRVKLFSDVASRVWHRRSLRLFAYGPLPSVSKIESAFPKTDSKGLL